MKISFPLKSESNSNMYGTSDMGTHAQLLPSDEDLEEIEKQRRAEELENEKKKVKVKPDNKKPASDSDEDGGDVGDEDPDAEDDADSEDDEEDDGGESGDESDEGEEEDDDEATASTVGRTRKIRRIAVAADGEYQNVFSGFPGIGKSSVFNDPGSYTVADSDSSTFPKEDGAFPANYMQHIESIRHTVDILLVSSHDVVRDALVANNIPFFLVYPTADQKADYMQRYADRGSPQPFLDLMEKNFEKFVAGCEAQEGCTHIVLKEGEFLSDVIYDYL